MNYSQSDMTMHILNVNNNEIIHQVKVCNGERRWKLYLVGNPFGIEKSKPNLI